jgi:hypothetical protein
MEEQYKDYDITVEAERDPDNNLFRALIFIGWKQEGVSITHQERFPPRGAFSERTDAEMIGLERAKHWVDEKTAAL